MSEFTTTLERLGDEREQAISAFQSQSTIGSYGKQKYGPGKWSSMVLEAETFMEDLIAGRKRTYLFAEAMGTADFPLLFADSLDRQLYGAYTATTPTWSNYARRGTVNDFREVKRFFTTGIAGILKPVKEFAEHEERQQKEGVYTYSVEKFEAGFGRSFEAMINDDLGIFRRLPQDLAQSAIASEENAVTKLIAGPSGPNTDFFTAGNGNLMAANPPLTRDNLQKAITTLMSRVDENGEPIMVTAVELVVGPGLALAAQQILEAKEYRITDAQGNVTILSGNGVAANLRVSVNYRIPLVAKTANAATSWWLFSNANTTARPALELGFLRGYESPALYEKVPDMRRIGGGAEVPWSFDHGDERKKIQHIFGGVHVDPRMSLASNGSGS